MRGTFYRSSIIYLMTDDQLYMLCCLKLASLGAGYVAPNPMVGALLLYKNSIIGEGYHQEYGKAHAEVNCINSVTIEDKNLIRSSTLYVTLEPCAHYGKTPPCTDLIIQYQIPKVVIGCRDPFDEVNGKGIELLRNAGIDVTVGVLQDECKQLNKRFFTFLTKHRPYIILKWAQTVNGKIAASGKKGTVSTANDKTSEPASTNFKTTERLFISNEFTNRLVHKWRSEEAAILAGTNTVLCDDPELSNRLWTGKNPIRLIVDMDLRLPLSLKIFSGHQSTIIFNTLKYDEDPNLSSAHLGSGEEMLYFYGVTEDVSIVPQILNGCYQKNIQSILVEGGAQLLQSFIDEDRWDEARIITNETLHIEKGLAAPELSNCKIFHTEKIFSDSIRYYYNNSFSF